MKECGIHLKWFGNKTPIGFTETIQHWKYIQPQYRKSEALLEQLYDMRIPVEISDDDLYYIIATITKGIKELKDG